MKHRISTLLSCLPVSPCKAFLIAFLALPKNGSPDVAALLLSRLHWSIRLKSLNTCSSRLSPARSLARLSLHTAVSVDRLMQDSMQSKGRYRESSILPAQRILAFDSQLDLQQSDEGPLIRVGLRFYAIKLGVRYFPCSSSWPKVSRFKYLLEHVAVVPEIDCRCSVSRRQGQLTPVRWCQSDPR